jgi:hypothetical protein
MKDPRDIQHILMSTNYALVHDIVRNLMPQCTSTCIRVAAHFVESVKNNTCVCNHAHLVESYCICALLKATPSRSRSAPWCDRPGSIHVRAPALAPHVKTSAQPLQGNGRELCQPFTSPLQVWSVKYKSRRRAWPSPRWPGSRRMGRCFLSLHHPWWSSAALVPGVGRQHLQSASTLHVLLR